MLMNVFSVYCTHAAHVFCVHKAELAVELDLTKVTSGLGLEVDWADGKTLFIKSVKALLDQFHDVLERKLVLSYFHFYLSYSRRCCGVNVPRILKAEGAVPHWNKKHAANPVAAGDRIISINGKAGDPKAIRVFATNMIRIVLLIGERNRT